MPDQLPDHIVTGHSVRDAMDRNCLDCGTYLYIAEEYAPDRWGRQRLDTWCPYCGARWAWAWYPAGLYNGPCWNLLARLAWPDERADPARKLQPQLFTL